MHITINLAYEVSAEAMDRVRLAAMATELNDPMFNGDTITVERGDFTCIPRGAGHRDAGSLFALVNAVLDNGPFAEDEGHVLVPFAAGGVWKVLPAEVAQMLAKGAADGVSE